MNVGYFVLTLAGVMLSTTAKVHTHQVVTGGTKRLPEPEDAVSTRIVTCNTVVTGGSEGLITYRSTVDQLLEFARAADVVVKTYNVPTHEYFM